MIGILPNAPLFLTENVESYTNKQGEEIFAAWIDGMLYIDDIGFGHPVQ